MANEIKQVKKEITRSQASGPSGLMTTVIAVAVTAIVVGGGVYAWKKKDADSLRDRLSNEARLSRMELEDRITKIKDTLQGAQTEKTDLENKNKELEEKANLIAGAKKEFSDKELGISFYYPVEFGEVSIEFADKNGGKVFLGKFSKTDKVYFGGVSKEFKASSTELAFLEQKGYEEKDGKYILRDAANLELKPTKTVNFANGKALVLSADSFGGKPNNLGGNLGSMLNLKKEKYSGVTFMDSDFGIMPAAEFEKMIASVRVQ